MPDPLLRQQTATCPNCGRRHGPAHDPVNGRVCECGETLRYVVPVFAPTMGGPCWWGWKDSLGRTSWDARTDEQRKASV